MSTVEEQTLEFNILSAVDLKKVTKFGKQSCFAVVYVNSSQKMSTKVDRTGGRNPSWNSKLVVSCDEQTFKKAGAHVTLEIYSDGRITNKLVGIVTIPLNDIARDGKSGATKPQVMGYKVRRKSGKIQGVLNLAVKLGDKKIISTLPAPRVYGKQQSGACYPLSAYPSVYPDQSSFSFGSPQRYYGYESPQRYYGSSSQKYLQGHGIWRSTPQY